jgi:hypothetical protein
MSVLIEAITVVFRNDTAEAQIQGGIETIRNNPPNGSFRTDGKISAVGFMTPSDVEKFVSSLQRVGFSFIIDGVSVDIAVCDQNMGFSAHNDWLDTATDERGVRCCWLLGHEQGEMAVQEGWEYERSMYTTGSFRADDDQCENLKFLRKENGLEVYWDEEQNREVYAGRSGGETDDLHTERRKALLFAAAVKVAYDGLLAEGWMSVATNMYADEFPHLIMRYRNQLAVIFLDVSWNETAISKMDNDDLENLRNVANQLNATPINVSLRIFGDTEKRLETITDVMECEDIEFTMARSYLAHDLAIDGEWLAADHDLDEDIELSIWELHDFGIQIVRDSLERDGNSIEHYDSKFETLIQIQAEINGERTFIVCRTVTHPVENAVFDSQTLQKASEFAARNDAVLKTASVTLANSDDPFHPEGIGALPLFRGKDSRARFDGLKDPTVTFDG